MDRPVVSYDDITLPYQAPPPRSYSPKPPPSKKRKWSNKPKGRHHEPSHHSNGDTNGGPAQHKNAPSSSVNLYDVEEVTMEEEEEESRELTYEEIWDDSALIDAWNAATEEYEAYNGPDKGWKAEPAHKSPLWYNIPPVPSKSTTKTALHPAIETSYVAPEKAQDDSEPLNFDTFVPSHDPSLDLPIPPSVPDYASQLRDLPGPMVSQDEAFTRALGAMYWGGYWTAMYHCQRNTQHQQERIAETAALSGEEEEEEEEESKEFVSTQR